MEDQTLALISIGAVIAALLVAILSVQLLTLKVARRTERDAGQRTIEFSEVVNDIRTDVAFGAMVQREAEQRRIDFEKRREFEKRRANAIRDLVYDSDEIEGMGRKR